MEFKKHTLPNGLTIIGEVNKAAKSAGIGFFVRTGSRDETMDINGVSHFLEHMLFKGTETMGPLEVNQAFDKTGAQFNAFTSEESTVYYAAVLPEYLMEVADLWMQLLRPALRDEDFDIEKNVIKEEIAMYQDLPSFDVIDRCRTLHYDGHPCGYSVLGSVESIDALTADRMREYFSRRYAADNCVLACAGNFDWQALCALAEEKCSQWQARQADRTLDDPAGSGRRERITKKNLALEHICLISKAASAQDPGRFAATLLGMIVGDDVGSRFFWELVDKALAEAASLQHYAMDGTGMFCTYIRCGRKNVAQVMDIVNGILRSLASDKITEDELQKAKNKIVSALVLKNELPMGRLLDVGMNWMYLQEHRTVEQDIDAIKSVTIQDIHDLTDAFDLSDFTQFAIGPEDGAGA